MSDPTHGRSTLAIHTGQAPDPVTGAIVAPLSLATTFVMDAVGEARAGYDYSRSGNPTRSALEETLAVLEARRRPSRHGRGQRDRAVGRLP